MENQIEMPLPFYPGPPRPYDPNPETAEYIRERFGEERAQSYLAGEMPLGDDPD